MKNGFTLVELLGVIVILAVLATIAVIAVDNSIKKSKVTSCLAQKENIIEATRTWQTDYPTTVTKNVFVSQLINEGYLDEDLKDPMTDGLYKNNGAYVRIEVSNSGSGKYSYDYELYYASGSIVCR